MARKNVSNKLKLIFGYEDADKNAQVRQMTIKNLKNNVDAAAVTAVGTALGSLQDDTLDGVYEIVENLVETE